MKHTIKHELPIDVAKKATQKAFESYAERFEKFNPTANWKSDYAATVGFEAKGIKLGGDIALREDAIDIEMEVPFLFKPFRAKAVTIIEEEIVKWIERARKGEFDNEETEEE